MLIPHWWKTAKAVQKRCLSDRSVFGNWATPAPQWIHPRDLSPSDVQQYATEAHGPSRRVAKLAGDGYEAEGQARVDLANLLNLKSARETAAQWYENCETAWAASRSALEPGANANRDRLVRVYDAAAFRQGAFSAARLNPNMRAATKSAVSKRLQARIPLRIAERVIRDAWAFGVHSGLLASPLASPQPYGLLGDILFYLNTYTQHGHSRLQVPRYVVKLAVDAMISAWGKNSSRHPDSLLMQVAVENRWRIPASRLRELYPKDCEAADSQYEVLGPLVDEVLQWMRVLYQLHLDDFGIHGRVRVYRGIVLNHWNDTTEVAPECNDLGPLTSWSLNRSVAQNFATNRSGTSMVLDYLVERANIFTSPHVGLGAANEYEVVILGAQNQWPLGVGIHSHGQTVSLWQDKAAAREYGWQISAGDLSNSYAPVYEVDLPPKTSSAGHSN